MSATIDNIDQITAINEAFVASNKSYFTIKIHYTEHLSVKYQEMTDEAKHAAWFQTLLAEETLRAILATQIKIYRIYFVTQSKKKLVKNDGKSYQRMRNCCKKN
jgi:hypothetical protein